MSTGMKHKSILDGERIWKHYYVTMGKGRSYNKLAEWGRKEFGINEFKGTNWALSAYWQAGWRWALKNIPEIRKIMDEVFLSENGMPLTDDLFGETVVQHAKSCLTYTGYNKFLADNPELEKYRLPKEKSYNKKLR